MRNMRYRLVGIVWILAVLTSVSMAGGIESSVQAIDVAGKQRMLSFRILRDYLMVSMETDYKNPKGDMVKNIEIFSQSLKEISAYSKDSKVQSALGKTKKTFESFKQMLPSAFDTSKGSSYLGKAVSLSNSANQVVLALSKDTGEGVINQVGRLRAVSQEISALYLLKTVAKDSESMKKQMQKAMGTFRKGLDALKKIELVDATMEKKLKKLKKIYIFFEVMNASDSHTPIIVCKKADKMLKIADVLTQYLVKTKK